ncbi:hypothetical protein MYE70_13485 [Marinobacter alexandrii]|uniref:hypothetical protein n=1 Tax=Marinobacter alexandrii TaxID=2570351 RepID=UPI001FFE475E|nr:hypothetical protein [Marinobacter alexandrii]MCK2150071.1 hypothetical protein [Marinobacter alexandrii]
MLDTDSQPWFAFAFMAYIFSISRSIRVPRFFGGILFFWFLGLFFAILEGGASPSVVGISRGVFNYLAFFFVFLGFYNFILRWSFPEKIFLYSFVAWILGALIEVLYPEFISFFAPIRTSEGRGLTSFAPEPTFFAMFMFFAGWIYLVNSKYNLKKSKFVIVLVGVVVFAVAKSAMISVFVILSLLFFLMFRLSTISPKPIDVFWAFVIGVVAFSVYFLVGSMTGGARALILAKELLLNGSVFHLFYTDPSLNHRLEHVVFSIHGFVSNNFWPGGFSSFSDMHEELVPLYDGFFWEGEKTNKIMSWIGDWVYQLGFFGMVSLLILVAGSLSGKRSFFEMLFLITLLFSAVPVSSPLVAMLFASFYARKALNTRVRSPTPSVMQD